MLRSIVTAYRFFILSAIAAALAGCGYSARYVVREGVRVGSETDVRGIQALYEQMSNEKFAGKAVPRIKFSTFTPPISRPCATAGEVRISVVVDSSNGLFTDVRLISSTSDAETNASLLGSVEKWAFSPFIVDGRSVRFVLELPFLIGNRYC
jgi:TonB family protein